MSTYDVNAPNANQSPSLFPAQANGNFTRLKQIIDVEHNFTDSDTPSQGLHKQITFINRTGDPLFPGGNAVLYTELVNGASQLFYFNGNIRQQLTPAGIPAPYSIIATVTLAAGASVIVYPIPSPNFDYNGIGTAVFQGGIYSFYYLNKYQGTTDKQIVTLGAGAPTLFFDGSANLLVKNNASVSRVIKVSLILNRIAL